MDSSPWRRIVLPPPRQLVLWKTARRARGPQTSYFISVAKKTIQPIRLAFVNITKQVKTPSQLFQSSFEACHILTESILEPRHETYIICFSASFVKSFLFPAMFTSSLHRGNVPGFASPPASFLNMFCARLLFGLVTMQSSCVNFPLPTHGGVWHCKLAAEENSNTEVLCCAAAGATFHC